MNAASGRASIAVIRPRRISVLVSRTPGLFTMMRRSRNRDRGATRQGQPEEGGRADASALRWGPRSSAGDGVQLPACRGASQSRVHHGPRDQRRHRRGCVALARAPARTTLREHQRTPADGYGHRPCSEGSGRTLPVRPEPISGTGGIRTPGPCEPAAFKAAAFVRSATVPPHNISAGGKRRGRQPASADLTMAAIFAPSAVLPARARTADTTRPIAFIPVTPSAAAAAISSATAAAISASDMAAGR